MEYEKKYFGQGQGNFDDADFLIQPHQWVNMENCRIGSTDKGVIGTVESIGGTNLLSSPEPSVTFVQIGSAEDVENRRIIYFLKNLHGPYDKIVCYDINADTFYNVLLGAQVTGFLNFDKNSLIHSARIVNGMLYWTDNLNQPRRINIDAAINLNHPGTYPDVTAYSAPMNPEVVTIARRPPDYPLTFTKVTSGSISSNQIKENAFRFTYFYRYRDGEESTLAPHSSLANYNFPDETYNAIDVKLQFVEKIDQDVQEVLMVAIYVVDNTSFVIKKWNKSNAAEATQIANHNDGLFQLTYRFANNSVEEAVDAIKLAKPFDTVPLLSEALEQGSNRLFLGNNVIGYDTPTSTSLAVGVQNLSLTTTPVRSIKFDSSYKVGIVFYDQYMRQCGVVFGNTSGAGDRAYADPTSYVSGLTWFLNTGPQPGEIPDWAYYYSIVSSKNLRTRYFLQLRGRNASYVTKDDDGNFSINKSEYLPTLNGCAFDISPLSSFAMGYVFTPGDFVKIYIDSTVYTLAIVAQQGNWIITELQDLGTLNPSTLFLFEIYTPYKPTSAEAYFEQGEVYSIVAPGQADRRYSIPSGVITGDVYLVERNGINRIHYTRGPGEQRNDDTAATIGAVYTSQDATDSTFTAGTSPIGGLAGFNIETNDDRWIIKATGGVPITFELSGTIKVMPDSNRTWRIYVESNIHTQTILIPDTTLTAYVESEHTFNNIEVTLAAGDRLFIFHSMSVANSIYYRDVNITITLPSNNISYIAEVMSPNDKFYQNWFTNAGRIQQVDRIGQQHKQTGISWSNTFIPGTITNGLSTFDALDQKILPGELGPLRKLIITSKVNNELGAVMLGICEAETASLYLGEAQLLGSAGNAFIAQSTNVIGTVNILKGSFGTINPESVTEFRGNVYWVDILNGKVVQYSLNGLFPISNYKMTRYWKLFSQQYLSMTREQIEALGSRPFIFSTVDPHHWELLITVPKLLNVPPRGYLQDMPNTIYPFDIWDGQAKTLVYKLNIEPNFWQGSYSFTPEGYTTIENKLFLYKNGQLYEGNDESIFGYFFAVLYKSRIMFISNQVPSRPKVYNNMSLEVNMLPTLTYLLSEQPFTQATNLQDFDWENKEGVLYSQVYRNILTPSATGLVPNALVVGEKMRTYALRIMLEFTVTNQPVELRFVNIGYSMSLGHKT